MALVLWVTEGARRPRREAVHASGAAADKRKGVTIQARLGGVGWGGWHTNPPISQETRTQNKARTNQNQSWTSSVARAVIFVRSILRPARRMPDDLQRQIAHMQMVQSAIARMSSNCFALKTLSVTLTAAIIAFAGTAQKPTAVYLAAALPPILVFWWLDAKYLQVEKLFRHLYEDVRHSTIAEPFDMSTHRYRQKVHSVARIAFSWPVMPIHFVLLVVLLAVAVVLFKS
jgi:hypothetical protein